MQRFLSWQHTKKHSIKKQMCIISYKIHCHCQTMHHIEQHTLRGTTNWQTSYTGTMININSQHVLTDGHDWLLSFWSIGKRVTASYPLREHGQLCLWPWLDVGWPESKHFPSPHLWAAGTMSPLTITTYYNPSQRQRQNFGFGYEQSCSLFA